MSWDLLHPPPPNPSPTPTPTTMPENLKQFDLTREALDALRGCIAIADEGTGRRRIVVIHMAGSDLPAPYLARALEVMLAAARLECGTYVASENGADWRLAGVEREGAPAPAPAPAKQKRIAAPYPEDQPAMPWAGDPAAGSKAVADAACASRERHERAKEKGDYAYLARKSA